ncbi:hypothetical protein R1sor_017035 [Riccia sorocarpa]|uniref:Reverse transcriptase domain-containing protein n=1 Tax=Riccia sorocarpa TaxID=122646 RepID=A0ABD3I5N5_9MARC
MFHWRRRGLLLLRKYVSKFQGEKERKRSEELSTEESKGEPALRPFRSWALNNWGRKHNVQIESVQEARIRAILTILSSPEEREEILRQPHPPIRGCHTAHFAWTEEMDDDAFIPEAKPVMIEISRVPLWAKEDLPKIFRKLGQVLQIPQDSRDLVKRDVNALIYEQRGITCQDPFKWKWENAGPLVTNRTHSIGIDNSSFGREVANGTPRRDTEKPWSPGGWRVPHRRCASRSFISKEKPDFFALQETHIEAQKLKFYVVTLAPGYTAIASSAVGRKRGVALLFKSEYQLLSSGEDVQGRYVWGSFKVSPDIVNVASIYAPNQTGDMIPFWDRIRREFLTATWVALGATQVAERGCYYLGLFLKTNIQAEDEALVFQEMCNTLGVTDARPWAARIEGPKFTRAQFREGKFIWSRLDRLYAPDVRILKMTHHSRREIKTLQYRKKDELLHVPAKEKSLQDLLKLGENNLTHEQEAELQRLIEEVRELQAWKHHRWKLTCRDKFIAEGDACTSYFFRKFKKRRARTTLSKLKNHEGVLMENQKDIAKVVQDNFTCLYSAKEQSLQERSAVTRILQDTHQNLSPQQVALLGDLPSERKLLDSLLLLPSGKSPGPDGMGTEVMRILWPVIGESYHRMALELWSSGSLLPHFKDGLICLLPKIPDPDFISHWRPITLLNATYRLMAKLLAARLALVLPSITPIEQQGFVKGRGTQNYIITFCLVHEALKRQRKSALFFSLDQEKAYDKLCPEYLWSTMAHLGFPPTFISILRALQHQAESRILLNGHLLPPFIVGRGVRQGCPLSPLLYVLASILIINRLKGDNDRHLILPVVLDGGCQVSSVCLADDLAIFTELHEESMANILQLLTLVELASGSKVNLLKSKVLMLGVYRGFPEWLTSIGLRLVDKREVTVYLGAPLTTVWHGVDNGENLLERLKQKVEYFSAPSLSFESRIVALRHGIFPTLIYQMLVTKFKKRTLNKFDQILREYVWSTDSEGRKKQSLSAWESLVTPVSWGGLGIFSAEDFQVALISRSILKALQNPHDSLWAPIYASVFLGSETDSLLAALSLSPGPKIPSSCPVASLLWESWSKLITLFRWGPKDGDLFLPAKFKDILFLQARKTLDTREATVLAESSLSWCHSSGIFTLPRLQAHVFSDGKLPANWPLLSLVLESQQPVSGSPFVISAWTAEDGKPFDPSWSASNIYAKLRFNKRSAQGTWLNSKWGFIWSLPHWETCWKFTFLKGLSQRNKIFTWRVSVAAFYVGKNARRLGFSEFSCNFCGGGVEDISHALWLCPRWNRFWLEVATKLPGWDQIPQLRDHLLTLPHVLFWALNSSPPPPPPNVALFRIWFLAVAWRLLWAERCTYKFQGKLNSVSLTKIIICMLEEINPDIVWIWFLPMMALVH